MRYRQSSLVLAVALAGCASGPDIPADNADFGPPPVMFEAPIREVLKRENFDPRTSQYEFSSPYKAYELQGFLMGGGVAWQGWVVDVRVRATGGSWQTYRAEMLGNQPQDVFEASLFAARLHPLWP